MTCADFLPSAGCTVEDDLSYTAHARGVGRLAPPPADGFGGKEAPVMNHDPSTPTFRPGGDTGAPRTPTIPALSERLDAVSKAAHIELVRASETRPTSCWLGEASRTACSSPLS